MSRLFIAALQVSLDGYLQGANGEVDWVDSWDDALGLVPGADTAVLGGGMYPGYQQLWGSVAADPRTGAAMLGREVTEGEADYALWTQRAPHYVLSTTIENVSWETAPVAEETARWRCLRHRRGQARSKPAYRGSGRRGPADRAPGGPRWRQVAVRGRAGTAGAPARADQHGPERPGHPDVPGLRWIFQRTRARSSLRAAT
jgi:hypothetical protein